LHWFLASLLLHIPKLAKVSSDAIDHLEQEIFFIDPTKTAPNDILEISSVQEMAECLDPLERQQLVFDYPMQALAFVAQVKAGLWVRNGILLRTQTIQFKDKTLRDCYDRNIFLLQYAALKFGSDLFLTTLSDRFGIVEWFNAEDREIPGFDPEKIPALIQEFFHIIIVILTERRFLTAEPLAQVFHREIIHQLAVYKSGIPFSRLSDILQPLLHLEDLKREKELKFEEILQKVADFKAPETISAQGVYCLKEHYFGEIDAWFWHYTRNQREEVEELLRKKFQNSSSEKLELNLPTIRKIPPESGFSRLDELIDGEIFCSILLKSLWKVTKNVFLSVENNFEDCLFSHLVRLLITSICIVESSQTRENSEFLLNLFHLSIEVGPYPGYSTRTATTLEIILGLVDRGNHPSIKEHSGKLRYFVRRIEDIGDTNIKKFIANWRTKSSWKFFNQSLQIQTVGDESEPDMDSRRKAANARKAAILAQFAQAQDSFMANFADQMDTDEGSEQDDIDLESEQKQNEKLDDWKFPEGNCIICQEEASVAGKSFGLICLIQKSSVMRQVDFQDLDSISDIGAMKLKFEVDAQEIPGVFNPFHSSIGNLHPTCSNGSRITNPGLLGTSCGHIMHFQCLQGYLQTIISKHEAETFRVHPETLLFKEFLCPLCKCLGNSLWPIFWKSKPQQRGPLDEFKLEELSRYVSSTIKSDVKVFFAGSQENQILIQPNLSDSNLMFQNYLESMAKGFSYSRITEAPEFYENFVFDNVRKLQILESAPSLHSKLGMAKSVMDIYSNTISYLEIAARSNRAVGDIESTCLVIDAISTPSQSLLHILSETCFAVVVSNFNKNSEYLSTFIAGFLQTFIPELSRKTGPSNSSILLGTDGFEALVIISILFIPQFNRPESAQVSHWIFIFAVFQIIRTILSILENLSLRNTDWLFVMREKINIDDEIFNPALDTALWSLVELILDRIGAKSGKDYYRKIYDARIFIHLCKLSLLTYCRKCALLVYSRFGIVMDSADISLAKNSSELSILLQFLRLPEFDQIIFQTSSPLVQNLVSHWCENLTATSEVYWMQLGSMMQSNENFVPKVTIPQPQIFQLVKLPHKLTDLIDIAVTTSCSHCGQGEFSLK
jgi:hypothetical protein